MKLKTAIKTIKEVKGNVIIIGNFNKLLKYTEPTPLPKNGKAIIIPIRKTA